MRRLIDLSEERAMSKKMLTLVLAASAIAVVVAVAGGLPCA